MQKEEIESQLEKLPTYHHQTLYKVGYTVLEAAEEVEETWATSSEICSHTPGIGPKEAGRTLGAVEELYGREWRRREDSAQEPTEWKVGEMQRQEDYEELKELLKW